MFRAIFISVVILFVGGCASVKETYLQDGSKAYALNCSGLARGWDKCYSSAGELCGTKGYNIMEKFSEGVVVIGGSTTSFSGAKTKERSMLISCKE